MTEVFYITQGRWNTHTEWFDIGNPFKYEHVIAKLEKFRLADLRNAASRGSVELETVEPEIRTIKITRVINVTKEIYNSKLN